MDTNVVLHQIDLVCHPAVNNVIILETVMQEVRHRDALVYKRLKEVMEDVRPLMVVQMDMFVAKVVLVYFFAMALMLWLRD